MRRRGKTFLSLFLSAVIVTGQPVLAADFSAGEETFISETTEQEGDVSEASAIFEDTVDSDSEMRYEKYEATVSSEILDLGQTGVNGGGWERLEIKNTGTESWQIKSISELNDFRLEHLEHPLLYEGRLPMKVGNKVKSVPAHVEMMGLIGAGNNPMVGMTVAVAVSIEEAAKAGKF